MKSKRKVDVPLASTVLRGVVMHAQPHTLVRPGRLGLPTLPARPHPLALAGNNDAAADVGRSSTADERALAEERKLGYAAGRAAAAAEAEQALQAVIDEARSRAIEAGRLQGLGEGREQARVELEQAQAQAAARANADVARRIEQLDVLLNSISSAAAAQLADAEDDLVALGHDAICRMLGESAATPAMLRRTVKHLLDSHGQRAQLAVHIHPEDLDALQLEADAAADPWRWVGDNSVQLGGVILRSAEGSLDARLESQLDALRDTLLRVRRERRAAAADVSMSSGRPA